MGKAYDSIRQGLEEAIAYSRGENRGAMLHKIKFSIPDEKFVKL